MIQIGSLLSYNGQICRVQDIRRQQFGGDAPRDYYILRPIYEEKTVLYVPVGESALEEKMHRLLGAEDVRALIRNMPWEGTVWIEDDRARSECYRKMLARGDQSDLIRIIKTLYQHKQEAAAQGRKLHAADEMIFQLAEKRLYDEFSVALELRREDVLPFILKTLEDA